MIQFNLLPDVKIEFIKTRARKRLIMLISAVASAGALAIFVMLFIFVRVSQTKHINDLDNDIKSNVSKIQETKNLDEILTIQNQLNSLPGLHDQKVVSSRLVDYLTMMTPNQATISDVTLDYEAGTITIQGNADALLTVNKFTDTIKFTEYKVNDGGDTKGKAFRDVVLQSFSVSPVGQNTAASYQISFAFEPAIFAQVKEVAAGASEPVTLTVPKIISTRSETERPKNLFEKQPAQPGIQPGGAQ